MLFLRVILALIMSFGAFGVSHALTYPSGTPDNTTEVPGGYFHAYFTNIFSSTCPVGYAITGFEYNAAVPYAPQTTNGTPKCGKITA